jgi:hypothetical protein
MKVGDLIHWYDDSHEETQTDTGLVIEVSKVIPSQVRIRWNSGDEDSWLEMDHPKIGVLSESR